MKIGFIGLGNMAQAMIGGVLRKHLAVPEEIYGSAKTAETESKVHEMFGITVTGDNLETARQAELLILAVKPQFLEKVIGQISDIDLTGKTILSIAAGKALRGWKSSSVRRFRLCVRCQIRRHWSGKAVPESAMAAG